MLFRKLTLAALWQKDRRGGSPQVQGPVRVCGKIQKMEAAAQGRDHGKKWREAGVWGFLVSWMPII